jgi:hypothetical protein
MVLYTVAAAVLAVAVVAAAAAVAVVVVVVSTLVASRKEIFVSRHIINLTFSANDSSVFG